ncbi:MAG TPA: protein kinase [Thermoanaerobaculia bacterium]|nr:protein kinase [Thermoanaerobaculia bacterium]
MDPERWERVKDLFQEALERAPEERGPHLKEVCREDAGLRGDVERLLSAHARGAGFLGGPAVHLEGPSIEGGEVPRRIGEYRILRELGQGGMGTVFLAERDEPGFRRTVAIKVVRPGMETGFVLRRFHTERQILASLENPGIARLYDGGTTEDGRPYFVMEYVEGTDLLTWCEERKLTVPERLRLFRRVCDAVQFAHQNLVVHRDLKPSNILVTPAGEPKLLDFGIAKLLSPVDGSGDETGTLVRLMTPDFASPEQILGRRITTASDVYALGVVLYELLSGRRPYSLRGHSPAEIERIVGESAPERPSAAAPPGVKKTLRGDLDNVVLKALEKDPARRYPTAAELSDDIERHLDGFPVRALPNRAAYRAAKFIRRHRLAVGAAFAVALALVGGLAAAVWQARIARNEREVAQRHLTDLRGLLTTVLFEFHDSVRDLPGSTPARELVIRRALEYLEKISRQEGATPDMQRDLAEAYQRISRVQSGVFASHVGNTAGALRSVEKAVEIRRALVRAFPANEADRLALARAELDSAQVLLSARQAEKAIQAAHRAEALLKTRAASKAGREGVLELARSRRYLGIALATAGRRDEALKSLRAAIGGLSMIAEKDPGNDASRRDLASTLQILIHNLPESESEEAFQSYSTAVSLQNMLLLNQPSNAGIKRELAYTHFSMGYFCERLGDTRQAIDAYSRALRIRQELAAADPRNADAQLRLADAYHGIGFVEGRAGMPGATDYLLRALDIVQTFRRLDPANTQTTVVLGYLYGSLGTASETGAPKSVIQPRLRMARDWYAKSRQVFLSLRDQGRLGGGDIAEIARLEEKISEIDGKLAGM